jgi:dTDP-4-dehydrorhamnose 3,5-epimerase-like enzyme
MHAVEPIKLSGTSHVDARGLLLFNNQAVLTEFKRMYSIENAPEKPFRGWHGHKFEAKGFICLEGRVRIGGVRIDDWTKPSAELNVFSEELEAGSMDFVYLPAGYANAILSLEGGSTVLVFSSSTLTESKEDDYRFDPGLWLL